LIESNPLLVKVTHYLLNKFGATHSKWKLTGLNRSFIHFSLIISPRVRSIMATLRRGMSSETGAGRESAPHSERQLWTTASINVCRLLISAQMPNDRVVPACQVAIKRVRFIDMKTLFGRCLRVGCVCASSRLMMINEPNLAARKQPKCAERPKNSPAVARDRRGSMAAHAEIHDISR
jgi:hypothetical protein